MGLKEDVNRIFQDVNNFDESGFARFELITPELGSRLCSMTSADRKELLADGYFVKVLDQDGKDVLIYKYFGNRLNLYYSLKLYYNAKMRGDLNGTGRTGEDQQPEADDQGTGKDR